MSTISETSMFFRLFTFTGKERDEETCYTYHGARYYDADLLTSWMAVDPMSDKYPSLSPYNFCAWNPVKLVDPDGRDWDPDTEKDVINPYRKEVRARMLKIEQMRNQKENQSLYCDQYNEYQAILNELNDLGNDHDHIYKVNFINKHRFDGAIRLGKEVGGKRIINVNIKLKAASANSNSIFRHLEAISHELKHAHQFFQGKLGFVLDNNDNQIISTNNKVLEREAHTRGDMFLDHNVTNSQPMKYDFKLDPDNYILNSNYDNFPENFYSINEEAKLYWHKNHK